MGSVRILSITVCFQEVQNTMRDLTEAHEKLQQERALFTLDVEEMERALGEAERLLME